MLKILYTGAFRFPNHDAAAKRVLGNAKALEKMGHNVSFAGWEEQGRDIDRNNEGYNYQGFKYTSQAEFRTKKNSNPIKRLFGFLSRGNKTLDWIKKQNNFDTIFVYNPPAFFAFKLLLFCRENSIKLVLDNTEWYESSHLIGGQYGLASIENFIRMKVVYPKFDNIIVISDYLKNHFSEANTTVINVPPLLNSSPDKQYEEIKGIDCLRIIYAGSPGKKDDIFTLISLLPQLNEKGNIKTCLRILGPEPTTLKQLIIDQGIEFKTVKPYLELYGRVPMEEVKIHYQASDFSIILRENKRYAVAGFPTKFVESIACGVPVIANKVGDIEAYITKFEVGFLVDNKDILNDLLSVLSLYAKNSSLKKKIQKKCYHLARDKFLFDNYTETMKKVL